MLIEVSDVNADNNVSVDLASLSRTVESHDLFQGLDLKDIERLVPACRVKVFENEEVGCHCGDAHHDAFLVTEGGLEHVVDLAGFSTALGLGGLLAFVQPHVSARPLGTAELLAIDTAMLNRIMERNTDIGFPVLRNLAKKLLVSQVDRQSATPWADAQGYSMAPAARRSSSKARPRPGACGTAIMPPACSGTA